MKLLFCVLLTVLTFSCASRQLIKDGEYADSHALYKQSQFEKSLEKFPKKEENGFIVSVEKAWISFWNKKGDNSELEKQIKSIDQRQYISISQEAEFFFFNETADGYIPSEHEVIALHLINSMIYMQQQRWDEAGVEARRASYFLQKIFNPNQPHFDDPALRLWLATVWMSLNEWGEAQVDLRRICEMTSCGKTANSSIKNLLDLKQPPKFFRLYMGGSGPELKWSESSPTPEFLVQLKPSVFSSSGWYDRHIKRNTVIRDTVLQSNYMSQYAGIKTSSGAQRAFGYSFGGATRLLGVTLGTAIAVGGVYVLAQGGGAGSAEPAGYIIGAGVLVGKYFWDAGGDLIDTVNKDATDYEKRNFEDLRTYRFVRFLPNQFDFELNRESNLDQINRILLFKPQSATEVEYVLNP